MSPSVPRPARLALLLAAAAPAVAALPAAPASAARSGTWAYDVTFKAELVQRWSHREAYTDDCRLTGELCTRDRVGEGSTRTLLRTRRPHRLTVLRSRRGRPVIGADADPVPLTGETVRSGSLTTTYGGPWKAGNPDHAAPTDGCGRHALREEVSFAWRGSRRVSPSIVVDVPDGSCPTGPGAPPTWKNGASPSLMETLADVAPSKFLGTKQFTIRGHRASTGAWPARSSQGRTTTSSSSGEITATWTWEATFRLAKRKRR